MGIKTLPIGLLSLVGARDHRPLGETRVNTTLFRNVLGQLLYAYAYLHLTCDITKHTRKTTK